MNLDFDDAADRVPTQEVNIVETRQVGEYAIKCVRKPIFCHSMLSFLFRAAKFSNVSSISLYFPSQGRDCTRIYHLGFLGHWSEVTYPIIAYLTTDECSSGRTSQSLRCTRRSLTYLITKKYKVQKATLVRLKCRLCGTNDTYISAVMDNPTGCHFEPDLVKTSLGSP